MDSSRLGELPGLLRTLADDLTTLPDPATLPRVGNWRVEWDKAADTLMLSAQLYPAYGTGDLGEIAEVNQWATALGGGLRLGKENASAGFFWRQLAAVADLPGGLRIEIWTHLEYHLPTGAVTAAARLLAA